ncbi:MAG TPA: biopolymer transporter ExbD [Aquabacterium sp.]|uniref:ExbD/TolR family protein n=1 Tax=Aquabacterium sp. TaxID=1872578 RepID=UPI002DAF404E|nr:biopolymer transporter ExbD [Aquabacterium sp.]HET6786325.1 biopolymer transporter ExbD [Aquabacterium sp.]HEX5372388.1 biopolymer transporter ExbD [Aquabacterium sp.]
MAFASFDNKGGNAPLAEINMVPLIDVMLVLLVIFIVTAPLLSHSVKLELPKASAQTVSAKAPKIDLSIDAAGVRYWDGQALSREEAAQRFAAQAQLQPQPEVHLRADQSVAYRVVAETLADASKAGLNKIGFVTDPVTTPGAK